MKLPSTELPVELLQDYHVRVLDRAIGILDALASTPEGLVGVELSQKLGLHKSTVHRLLAVLCQNGFVERKPGCAKYSLGWRLFELGVLATSRLNLSDAAKPYVARLARETGETAHLGVLCEKSVVSLVSVESQCSVRKPATVGRQTPLHCVSQGKVILAFLPAHDVKDILADYKLVTFTHNTITSSNRLFTELALVRGRGYAVDNEEFEEGLRCIAAPVCNHSGVPVAAIGIAGPTFRVGGDRLIDLCRLVTNAAADLSRLAALSPWGSGFQAPAARAR